MSITDDVNPEDLGSAIRLRRAGRPVRKVLANAGVSLAAETWSRYENGRVPGPKLETVGKIARALGLSAEELLSLARVRAKERQPKEAPSHRYRESDAGLASFVSEDLENLRLPGARARIENKLACIRADVAEIELELLGRREHRADPDETPAPPSGSPKSPR